MQLNSYRALIPDCGGLLLHLLTGVVGALVAQLPERDVAATAHEHQLVRMTAASFRNDTFKLLWRRCQPQDVFLHPDSGSQYCTGPYQLCFGTAAFAAAWDTKYPYGIRLH